MKTPRTTEEIEKIRETILDRALDIIVEFGLDGLTMRALASRLDMSAPNIYNFFSGKDELYLSLMVKGGIMLNQMMTQAWSSTSNTMDRARAMIAAYLRFGIEQPRYYEIMFILPPPSYTQYVGTPNEQLSASEYEISLDTIRLVSAITAEISGESSDSHTVQRRMFQLWSLLHGMIALHNNAVADFATGNVMAAMEKTVEELMLLLEWMAATAAKQAP
ncbi:MAG: TetR/AcrR family transcriptional regulator [Thermodesulfobacteriota bacterium]|nr:TetR/AcrR family transcriptional regulator [Thermodesulfobacteriota bacterium]